MTVRCEKQDETLDDKEKIGNSPRDKEKRKKRKRDDTREISERLFTIRMEMTGPQEETWWPEMGLDLKTMAGREDQRDGGIAATG